MKILAPILLVFAIDLTLITARTCTPKNWSKEIISVGNTWFMQLDTKASWPEQVEACKNWEPGRSTIATIRNGFEQKQIQDHFVKHTTAYIGGFEIGSTGKWYWFPVHGGLGPERIESFFWRRGEPHQRDGLSEACIAIDHKGWFALTCDSLRLAICELRCDIL